ncbi:hypothetical protein RDI58_001474 [Solanum bulbocastanum]|uniref:C-JID domain-containing protein n=1 Tax=Solanum bulbocastanum TaxID=147425 RepID=A0AAN8UBY2_SOLBU
MFDSHSLSLRMFTIEHAGNKIPSWFHHRGTDKSVSVNLPENWYACDNFLGFAVCYYDSLVETTAHLIPLCNRMPWMIQKLSLSNHSKCYTSYLDGESTIHLFAGVWDTSKANGKTPNDYGFIGVTFSGQIKNYGFRLLYKGELEHEALLQMRGDNDEPTEHSIWTRMSRYDDSGRHNEASCLSSKKQRSGSNVDAPVNQETL